MTTALYSSIVVLSALGFAAPGEAADPHSVGTATPIKHLIVLIGENRGLDHTFGVYTPVGKGETISNLLSKGIVNADGSPGPNFSASQQYSVGAQGSWYFGAPDAAKFKYTNMSGTNLMPQPNTNGTLEAGFSGSGSFSGPLASVALVEASGEADIDPQITIC